MPRVARIPNTFSLEFVSMRVVVAVLAVAALHLPAVAQQPGRGPGQGPGQRLPDHWVPFDSLAQAIQLSDAQRAAAQALHTSIDSIVRHGATVRAEMRQEMQRNPDREQMMRFQQRLQRMVGRCRSERVMPTGQPG